MSIEALILGKLHEDAKTRNEDGDHAHDDR